MIAKRAGLGRIIRPFDSMRMSRSNEVDREFGSIKESLWIGHSERVKKEHYYRLEDSDFRRRQERVWRAKIPMQTPMQNRLQQTVNRSKIEVSPRTGSWMMYRILRHFTVFYGN